MRIRIEIERVKGGLSKEIIKRIVRRHVNEVRFCWERELARKPQIQGRVSVNFIISSTGAVQTAGVAESKLGSKAVEDCVVKAVRRWRFPQPEGGGIVIATARFTLSMAGRK